VFPRGEIKSDFQGHQRSLIMMPFDMPCIRLLGLPINLPLQLCLLSCTVSEILSIISQNLRSRDP